MQLPDDVISQVERRLEVRVDSRARSVIQPQSWVGAEATSVIPGVPARRGRGRHHAHLTTQPAGGLVGRVARRPGGVGGLCGRCGCPTDIHKITTATGIDATVLPGLGVVVGDLPQALRQYKKSPSHPQGQHAGGSRDEGTRSPQKAR